MVGNALVAIDTGPLAGEQEALMRLNRARALPRRVHRLGAVAVAALKRIVGLHPGPFVERELESMFEKFFPGVDGSEDLPPYLLGGLQLPHKLIRPVVWNMAIGAMRANARPVVVVDGRLQLFEHVLAHFVTR